MKNKTRRVRRICLGMNDAMGYRGNYYPHVIAGGVLTLGTKGLYWKFPLQYTKTYRK